MAKTIKQKLNAIQAKGADLEIEGLQLQEDAEHFLSRICRLNKWNKAEIDELHEKYCNLLRRLRCRLVRLLGRK